jgi:hypothetical protein
MAWLVELGERDLSEIVWPPRCAVCDRRAFAGAIEATGDHVVPIGGLILLKECACRVPCCGTCLKRARLLTIGAVSVMLVPWLLFLAATQIEVTARALLSHMPEALIAPMALMGVGIVLFWVRVIFTRAVRLYMNGPTPVGIVFRHRSYAEEVAGTNGLKSGRTSFLAGW